MSRIDLLVEGRDSGKSEEIMVLESLESVGDPDLFRMF